MQPLQLPDLRIAWVLFSIQNLPRITQIAQIFQIAQNYQTVRKSQMFHVQK